MRAFISHASSDVVFAEKLAADMRSCGVDAWLDSSHMEPVDSVARLTAALECDVFVLVLTPAAIDSPRVRQEMTAAMARSSQRLMWPPVVVLAEPCASQQIPPLWRDYHRYDATTSYAVALHGVLNHFSASVPSKAAAVAQTSGVFWPAATSDEAARDEALDDDVDDDLRTSGLWHPSDRVITLGTTIGVLLVGAGFVLSRLTPNLSWLSGTPSGASVISWLNGLPLGAGLMAICTNWILALIRMATERQGKWVLILVIGAALLAIGLTPVFSNSEISWLWGAGVPGSALLVGMFGPAKPDRLARRLYPPAPR